MNKIIAVDFDGVLFEKGEPNKRLIEFMIEAQKNDNRIVLWTSRTGSGLDEAVNECEKYGLVFDAVNENVIDSESRKIIADVYVDDKSIRAEFTDDTIVDQLSELIDKEVRQMPKRDGREYRSMPVMSVVRSAEGTESEPKSYKVRGYATTFDQPYLLYEVDGEPLYEQIDRHAFDDADMSDVIFQFDHEGRVFARNRNNTLTLTVDDHGLLVEADLGLTESSRSMWEDINAGLIDRMSFCFVVEAHEYDRKTKTDTVTKIGKLFDVSAVSIPANPFTDISSSRKRSLDGVIEAERAERLEADERAKKLRILRLKVKLMKEMNAN